jgi:gamma-glutamylcyclotransferase (GGCT)/AIG2-like uncharacterized protein YtfP/Leucine-rich repeat (LRR) protein
MRNLRKILDISEKEFADLHNLKKLDTYLRDEYEKEFPLEICQLTNLEELDIYGEFKELPKEFCNLQNLKKLSIGDFETFPIEICKLTNLEGLDIDGEFTKLPKEFSNLQNLKELDIDLNKLKELPFEICKLTNLEMLDIRGDFSKLPKEFSNLQNLKRIRICSNVKEISILQQLPNLESLEIFPNENKAYDISITNLTNLKRLEIGEFKNVEISNLKSLQKLRPSIENFLLSDLPNLKDIKGYISKIPHKWKEQFQKVHLYQFKGDFNLSEFPNLKELSLETGSFSIIGNTELKCLCVRDVHSITKLPKIETLESLTVSGILITEHSKVDKDFFINFPISTKLKKLSLGEISNLKDFPEWVKSLSDLEVLHISECGCVEIPDWIDELQNLKEISIWWSNLERVSEAVTNLKNLEELHLSMNHIKSYPQNLEKLKNLKELYIDEEKISFDEYNRIKRALPNTEISEKDIEIFVYGTLKKGFYYHEQLLKDAEFIGKATTEEKYPMISENGQYPYLIDKEGYGKKIEGEIYRISPDILKDIDLVEGYPKHYSRREIKVREHMTCQLCWRCAIVYFANFEIDYSKYELLSEFTG